MTVELALAGAAEIMIVNRSAARGQELVDLLTRHTPVKAIFQGWDENLRIPQNVDVLVNATSIGLYLTCPMCLHSTMQRSEWE